MTLEEYTCELFRCTLDELFSTIRVRQVVSARNVCMSVMREFTGMSLGQIGRHFNKDHCTVIYAIRTVKDLYTTDKEYRIIVDKVYDAARGKRLDIPGGYVVTEVDCMDEDMVIYASLV